jgi:tetratricopeptide (TPR) repeat protein
MSKQKMKPNQEKTKYFIYGVLILTALFYLKVVGFNLTMLDDVIILDQKHDYLTNASNIGLFFTNSFFNENDGYYRPMLSIYFFMVGLFSPVGSLVLYHLLNLIIHLLNIFLLSIFLKKSKLVVDENIWMPCLFFGINPVLTSAIAWIPGINDILLTTFTLLYFTFLIDYIEQNKISKLVYAVLCFALAMLTKETAIVLPIITLVWILIIQKTEEKKIYFSIFLPLLILCIGWFFARKNVLPSNIPVFVNAEMLSSILVRWQGILQYLGKVFIPLNLNPLPYVGDGNWIIGMGVLLAMGMVSWLYKTMFNVRHGLFAILWFALFLVPVFLTTKRFGEIFFEHRLYLPIIGIALILNFLFFSNSSIQKNTKLIALFIWVSISFFTVKTYLPVFDNPVNFWTRVGDQNPSSVYCNKTAALNLLPYKQNMDAIKFIEKAYNIDSSEAKVKFLYAKYILLPKNEVAAATQLFDHEIATNTKFASAYFERGMISFQAQKYASCIPYFKQFVALKPDAKEGYNNLLLCYELEKKWPSAYECAVNMNSKGFEVKPEELKLLADSSKAVNARNNSNK